LKILNCLLIYFLILVITNTAFSYEPESHEEISGVAFEKSILGRDRSFITELGIESIDQEFPNINNVNHTIIDLIKFGSSHEDVGPPFKGCTPFSPICLPERVLNHFLDPQDENERPLTVFGFTPGEKSTDWILEDNEEYIDQQYSVSDAMQYYYNAISLTDEENRYSNYGLLFQSVGHLMHHMQDMAQPEHVRNDPHVPFLFDLSLYEHETLERDLGQVLSILNKGSSLNIANFRSIRELWNTNGVNLGIGIADYSSNNFISANTNFYANMNSGIEILMNHDDYLLPQGNNFIYWTMGDNPDAQAIPGILCDTTPSESGLNYQRIYYQNTVINQYEIDVENEIGQETNAFAATKGIFALNTVGNESYPLTIDKNTVYCANEFLLPQAVTYSATATDYFFRGRFQLESISESGGTISITVKNISLGDYTMDDSLDATRTNEFEVFYDSTDGTRKPVSNLTNADLNLLPSSDLPFDASITLDFDLPADVDYGKQNPFILLFKGVIKRTTTPVTEEEGIAALSFTNKLHGQFLITPNFIPTGGVQGAYLVSFNNGHWEAEHDISKQAGNIDWKGSYVNGQPTIVLSWEGELSKYSPRESSTTLPFGEKRTDTIYQNGQVHDYAPCNVLGAAIREDTSNNQYTVVICEWNKGSEIRAYERPVDGSQSNQLYDPQTSPNGWQELASLQNAYIVSPSWAFNGNGTEAQALLKIDNSPLLPSTFLNRYKFEFNELGSTFTDLGHDPTDIQSENLCILNCTSLDDPVSDPCTNSSSYIYDRTDTSENENSTLVAIDYNNNQEILLFRDDEYSRQRISNGTVRSLPFVNTRSHSSSIVSLEKYQSTNSSIFSLEHEEIINYSSDQGIGNLSITSETIERSLIHIDLRHNYEIYRQVFTENIEDRPLIPGDDIVTQNFNSSARLVVSSNQNLFNTNYIFNQNVINSQTVGGSIRRGALPVPLIQACNNNPGIGYLHSEYPAPSSNFRTIYTATDTFGNVAFSVSYDEQDSNGNLISVGLHKIGNRDLNDLFPGAPDDASYEIRLIK